MAERKSSSGSGSGSGNAGASVVEAGAPATPKAAGLKTPKKVEIHAGGHVIMADPPAPTPAPIQMCSVCGQDPAECPHGDVGGWAVEGD